MLNESNWSQLQCKTFLQQECPLLAKPQTFDYVLSYSRAVQYTHQSSSLTSANGSSSENFHSGVRKGERRGDSEPPQIVDHQMFNYQDQFPQNASSEQRIREALTTMIQPKLDNHQPIQLDCESDIEGEGPAEKDKEGIQTLYEEDVEDEGGKPDEVVHEELVSKALQVARCIKKNTKKPLSNVICQLNGELMNNDHPFEEKKDRKKTQQLSISGRKDILNGGPLNTGVPQFFDTPRNVEIKRQVTRNNIEVITSKDIMIDVNRCSKPRDELEKDVAYVFVNKGYGLSLAKAEEGCDIDGNKYNSLLTAVIRSALRKLFDILIRNMQQQVEPLERRQEFLLRSPMVNCRKWLNKPELDTFFKIINEVYKMNHEPIYQDEVLGLYSKIRKQLEKRSEYYEERGKKRQKLLSERSFPFKVPYFTKTIGNFSSVPDPYKLKSTNTPPDPSQILNTSTESEVFRRDRELSIAPSSSKVNSGPEIEKEVAELYVRFKSEESVFLVLSKRHNVVSWQKNEIKDIIHKLIKIGLKKVLKYRKEYNLVQPMPQLHLSETLVNKMLTHPLAHQTRIAMVQVLMERTLNEQRTTDLVNQLVNCVQQIQTYS